MFTRCKFGCIENLLIFLVYIIFHWWGLGSKGTHCYPIWSMCPFMISGTCFMTFSAYIFIFIVSFFKTGSHLAQAVLQLETSWGCENCKLLILLLLLAKLWDCRPEASCAALMLMGWNPRLSHASQSFSQLSHVHSLLYLGTHCFL